MRKRHRPTELSGKDTLQPVVVPSVSAVCSRIQLSSAVTHAVKDFGAVAIRIIFLLISNPSPIFLQLSPMELSGWLSWTACLWGIFWALAASHVCSGCAELRLSLSLCSLKTDSSIHSFSFPYPSIFLPLFYLRKICLISLLLFSLSCWHHSPPQRQ